MDAHMHVNGFWLLQVSGRNIRKHFCLTAICVDVLQQNRISFHGSFCTCETMTIIVNF